MDIGEPTTQPTVFHYERSKDRPIDLGLVACSLLLGLVSLRHFHSGYSESGIVSWFYLAAIIWFFCFAILWLLKIAGMGSLAHKWTRIHLSLDDEGLTYVRGGMLSPRRWSWTELSEIECEGPGFLRGSSILIRRDAAGLMDKMTMDMTASGPRMRLRNVFDASPKEIIATLNEYRDRAVPRAGAATAG